MGLQFRFQKKKEKKEEKRLPETAEHRYKRRKEVWRGREKRKGREGKKRKTVQPNS